MMIKCQKCGFENQMGSIFCRECGEKLNMDAIDPNKLQKDVNKEKSIKLAKKRIREAISTSIALIVVAAFLAVVFYNGGLRKYEEPSVSEASARQKYNAAISRTEPGKVKYSYPEVNRMFKDMVVDPIAKESSFATVTAAEITYDEAKQKPVIYLWLTLKDKVPVIYTIHGDINFHSQHDKENEDDSSDGPLTIDVSRLDIGRLPLFVSTYTFLNGFSPLLKNDNVLSFFDRATNVEFSADGMTVEFGKVLDEDNVRPAPKAAPSSAPAKTPSSVPAKNTPSSAPAKSALKDSATNEKASAAAQKTSEEDAKKKQLEEERKRKAEEYRKQQKEKEEERKRKAEEEKERKKQEAEERKRKQEEENERRRQERENRRNDRYNNNNNYNSRNSRSSRSSRNRY